MQSEPMDVSDEDLLRRMLDGSEGALAALYRRRQSDIYRFALHMTGSRAAAEDVTQETFLTLMRDGRRFDPGRGSVHGYLLGIARNLVLRLSERLRSEVELPGGAGEDALSAGTSSHDLLGECVRQQALERIRQAVLSLPPRYREVVVLCDLEEMDYAAAAGAIGCAVGTVRSRLHRARWLLLEKLRATGCESFTNVRCCP